MSTIDLGFLEDCEQWQVVSRLFPSKFGGKPAWLNLEDLPSSADLECESCKSPMIFLCQIYAPYEEDLDNFHRTLFLFICRDSQCCKRNTSNNIKAFRSSLKRENKFYPAEPPVDEEDSTFCLSKWVTLCALCGCLSNKNCSKCKNTYYCSRAHQVADWKESHKNLCGHLCNTRHISSKLFPEKEVAMETEELETHTIDECSELEKFKQLEADQKTGTLNEISENELESHAKVDSDKTFTKFKERVAHNPDQVIRYDRGGQPLWIAKEPIPETVPKCDCCGSPRQFEFQIMPQTLSIIQENELDWGVIAVYSCSKSCTVGKDYKQEYVFKQDVSLVDVDA